MSYSLPGGFICKTAGRTRVADGAVRMDPYEQGVRVAVTCDGYHIQKIAAGLALCPEPAFRAAVECHAAFFLRLFKGVPVHVSQHQHGKCRVILNDCRYKSFAAFGCVEFFKCYHGIVI